ncbi:MAG TPA: TolB domain-containing protein [Paenisporosarcina sp.]|nr:TolB domain-containing protein [Paenisporosarcina sp.]
MAKLLHILVILCLVSPSIIHANSELNDPSVKVAFIKDGFLWIQENDKKEVLTDKKAVYTSSPQWSFDGKMLLYQKEGVENSIENREPQNELWVYDIKTKKHSKIFYDGYNPKWAPHENIVAFQSGPVLNISDLNSFYNIALGVSDYEWQPDGKGFIASSSASLRPDGWTNPILYTISIEKGYRNIKIPTKIVKRFFVIPKEVGTGEIKIPSITASSITFSPNEKWISFIVSPTASWAMDSEMLCVISVDGKEFTVIDELAFGFPPKWAYNHDFLGYIAGGGRIVFGFKNKNLKVTEPPAYYTFDLTPKNYAEMDFTWVDDTSLIVSRVTESEWSNDAKERPKPSLYFLTLTGEKQMKITTPPKDQGDFNPIFLPSIKKLTWLRKNDIVSAKGDLWIADSNGRNSKVWIRDVEEYSFFPSK